MHGFCNGFASTPRGKFACSDVGPSDVADGRVRAWLWVKRNDLDQRIFIGRVRGHSLGHSLDQSRLWQARVFKRRPLVGHSLGHSLDQSRLWQARVFKRRP
jgi:hypothetical protein